ncbi:unnamed protein product [Ostreobium quekettii]|uniref:Ion transport domain-containing protein n=1 Tax=Ostreobium quekettii TaxID=121088 RepID=A0A8S1JFK4_9CHLO|nr:unnamed protein product [Ostreobium quekettii]|eukprot:evm.model.scf_222.4 EVM.evm.TU.scf_222.4   scf_222:31904-32395(+)
MLIVFSSIFLIFLESANFKAVKGLRVLRAAKPLRAVTRSEGMRLILKAMTMSIAAMWNVSLVIMLFFTLFAILGVQLYSGRFYRWTYSTVISKEISTCSRQLCSILKFQAALSWLQLLMCHCQHLHDSGFDVHPRVLFLSHEFNRQLVNKMLGLTSQISEITS